MSSIWTSMKLLCWVIVSNCFYRCHWNIRTERNKWAAVLRHSGDGWCLTYIFVANGSNFSFIMIFDESKKVKLNRGMSSQRKLDRVNALLRQRQNEFVTSLAAETEAIQNTTAEMLSTSMYSPERPLVIIIILQNACNLYSDQLPARRPNPNPLPRIS